MAVYGTAVYGTDVYGASGVLTITTTTLPGATLTVAYNQTLAATGGTPAYTWSLFSGTLPTGITLASSTGILSGTPTTATTYNFTIRVTDSLAVTDNQALSIVVAAAPVNITTTSLPGASLTAAYNQTLAATGGTPAYTWSLFSGALPAGVTLAGSTGILSGTPSGAPGTANFTIRVTDSLAVTDNQVLSIVVAAAPVITTTTLPNGTVGAAYSQTLVTTGGTAPLAYSLFSGTLPAGVTLSTGGALSGTPTTATTYNFTVRVTDAAGAVDNQALTVIVGAPAAPIISGITVSSIGSSSALVSCTTDIPALVRINYGLTAGYGSATADGSLGTTHSRLVSPLAPSTLYHYQVRADSSGSVTLSGDGTFTTTAVPVSNRNLPTYLPEVAWSRARTGAFTIGTSTIGGSAQIGGLFSHYTFNALSGVVKDCLIARGRQGQDGAMNAGTMTLTLKDLDGTYNPENPASSLSPNVIPLRPIRIQATHNSITYGLFFGWITRIEHNPAPLAQETTIEAVDFFWWLDACKPIISLGQTTVGAAIGALLAACGLSDPAYIALDTGHTIPFLIGDGNTSALQLIQAMLVVDMGVFFVNGSGVVTYEDTTRRYGVAAVDDTFTTAMIGDARPSTDIQQVRNGWTVTRTAPPTPEGQPAQPDGAPQTAYDAVTRDNAYFGPRDGTPISSPYLLTDTQAGSLAAFKVLLYKEPTNPVRGIRLSNRDDTIIVKQLSRDLGDRVALTETLGGTSTTGFIEGVSHHIWGGGRFHETSYTLSKRRFDSFTIGTSVIGSATQLIGY